MKILWRVLMVGVLCCPGLVEAAVTINEIMYDVEGTDTGREWVEIWNDTAESIDLTAWKLFEANVAHKIVAMGNVQVPAGGYAIIADSSDKFLADNPGFAGLLFDSAFSLGNSGESVALKDPADVITDSVSYNPALGAAGDGGSLQKKADGAWVAATPSPGLATIAVQSSAPVEPEQSEYTAPNDGQGTVAYSAHSSQAIATISYEEPELLVTLGRSRLGFVGVPLSFEAKLKSVKNMPVAARSAYSWSMGDGTKESGQFVSHMYEFPGDYIVVLNTTAGGVNAVSKAMVKIVSPRFSLYAQPEHVEIENLDSHELNLGGFSIETGGSKFLIPEDTLIAPKARIKLSLATMRLNYGDGVIIKSPAGKVLGRADSPRFSEISTDSIRIYLPPGVDSNMLRERLMTAAGI